MSSLVGSPYFGKLSNQGSHKPASVEERKASYPYRTMDILSLNLHS